MGGSHQRLARSAFGISAAAGFPFRVLRFCPGGSATGRATAARRPCGGFHFVGAADRDVLLADRGWGGICTRRKTESVDRNLAGKYWPHHPCHYFPPPDGTVAREPWLFSQGRPPGNFEKVLCPPETPARKTYPGGANYRAWR